MIDKLLDFIRSLTYREVGIIALLSLLAAPGYGLWWSSKNPEIVTDMVSGERYLGSVDDCLLLAFRQWGKIRYRLVLNVGREPDAEIALSAGAFEHWGDDRSIELCRQLQGLKGELR